jgi:Protein of unknown function (DUF1073)
VSLLSSGPTIGGPLAEFLQASEIMPGSEPGYQLCKTIYEFHPLGGKMVDAPVKMAMAQQREITIPASPEERVREAFLEQWEADNADTYIAQLAGTARTYGIASIAVIVEGMKADQPLPREKLYNKNISYSIFDPLNTAGSLVLNQNPNSIDFMKTGKITVQGETYSPDRVVIFMNERPIYIAYTNSAFGFVGRSVYQRALYPLQAFLFCMKTDAMIARKAGLLIAKMKPAGSIIDNAMTVLFGQKRTLLKQGEVDQVLGITIEEDVNSLDLTNMEGAYSLARRNILETIAAADDMPAKLLNQETFAEGFGEGTEDAKYVAQYIERLQKWMAPAYKYMDANVQRRAWNPDFYRTIQKQYDTEYGRMDYETAFRQWQRSFSAVHPSLLREPESERIKVDDVKLKAIIAMTEVLMPALDPENRARVIQWAQDNFNELKRMFTSTLDLDYDALEEYAAEQQEQQNEMAQAGGEDGPQAPKAPKPFAATDGFSPRSLARRMSDQQKDDVQAKLAELDSVLANLPRNVREMRRASR